MTETILTKETIIWKFAPLLGGACHSYWKLRNYHSSITTKYDVNNMHFAPLTKVEFIPMGFVRKLSGL